MQDRVDRATNISNITNLSQTSLILIIGATTVIYKLLRQKTTTNIWIQITILFMVTISYEILNIWLVIGEDDTKKSLTYILFIGDIFFNIQHWIFALSYLRVAVNFKLLFSVNQDAIRNKLTKRNTWLNVIEYGGLFVT